MAKAPIYDKRKGIGGISISSTSSYEARKNATALLAAKIVDAYGNPNPLYEQMQTLIDDPEQLAAATLSLLNLLFAWSTSNGLNIEPLDRIIRHNLATLRNTPNG